MSTELQEFMTYSDYQIHSEKRINTTSIDTFIERILDLNDIILYGPPGTGKSYLIDRVLELLGEKLGSSKTVQFHSEYTYDDFIEGLKPKIEGGFEYVEGSFYEFCNNVRKIDESGSKIHPFFIDELNRANITAVFGEIMYLMDKKGIRELPTARTGKPFSIPPNVVIIGTMNTADKSIGGQIDFALRRRFRFLPVYPDPSILQELITSKGFTSELREKLTEGEYIKAFKAMNILISKHPLLGKELTLGHILWTPKRFSEVEMNEDTLGEIFRELVLPQIVSYSGSNTELLGRILGPELRDTLIFGEYPANDQILALLKSLQQIKIE
ncbi:5-methylcytosine-specific restriction protein B [Paenibacillus jamilae]|nr:5-methylcytosine-specific restriction protein B [Paenibacillus jamilae]